MAKKGTRKGSFNMSAAIRDVLGENPKLSAKEVEAELKKRHPREKLNSSSLSVAFSQARQKLGITKKERTVRRRKPGTGGAARRSQALDMSTLQAARRFVAEVGDVDQAVEAVRQLRGLQV
jgi:hypothetical protein